MPAYGACLLGAVNLSAFVENEKFNFQEFKETVRIAVRALNNILDEGIEKHPLEEQKESAKMWRQIGLGIMGLADMFIKLKIKYGSKESIEISDKIGKLMIDTALYESALLAKEYGTYPKYNNLVMETDFFKRNASQATVDIVKKYGLRNSQLLTCAPTGSISNVFGVSGGIEPIFAFSYKRKTVSLHDGDVYYDIDTPIAEEWKKKNNSEVFPPYFVKASDIDYKDRIAMQAVWQKHIDASISSTLNIPYESTVEDVKNIYKMAWNNGLKGCTIYRANSARAGVIVENNQNSGVVGEKEVEHLLNRGDLLHPDVKNLIGKGRSLQTGCGMMYLLAFADKKDGKILQTYISKGSTGGCNSFMTATSRLISLAARGGVSTNDIVDQLNSAPLCNSYARAKANGKVKVSPGVCCPNAIGIALFEMQNEFYQELNSYTAKENTQKVEKIPVNNNNNNNCPECGLPLAHEGGCVVCRGTVEKPGCGWTRCD